VQVCQGASYAQLAADLFTRRPRRNRIARVRLRPHGEKGALRVRTMRPRTSHPARPANGPLLRTMRWRITRSPLRIFGGLPRATPTCHKKPPGPRNASGERLEYQGRPPRRIYWSIRPGTHPDKSTQQLPCPKSPRAPRHDAGLTKADSRRLFLALATAWRVMGEADYLGPQVLISSTATGGLLLCGSSRPCRWSDVCGKILDRADHAAGKPRQPAPMPPRAEAGAEFDFAGRLYRHTTTAQHLRHVRLCRHI